ncbi:unnamed protein product [Fusarium langsethiae]|nr:unnamed protein product [Fusarium langsethiae]GKU22274.1 unnamed protein product [Fusarium langsethiae]
MAILPLAAAVVAVALFIKYLLDPFLSPLRHVPGPKLYAATKWRLAYEDWKGTRTRTINALHKKYGPVVRIAPNEISFNSLSALRTIYGPGSRFGRTSFYRMFDVYGEQNLFTFHSPKDHGDRKKLLSHAYSKTAVLKPATARMIERQAWRYLNLIDAEPEGVSEIFSTLHYYSLDNITAFVYGKYGATAAVRGSKIHRDLISDILHPSRRRLSWCIVHMKGFTQWLYRQSSFMGALVKPILPMQQPTTYTGIRAYALSAFKQFRAEADAQEVKFIEDEHVSILERLWQYHETQRPDGMRDLQMASECADHFLAGIDTTSDTLMFLVWSLSLPGNEKFQEKLREEVQGISDDSLNKQGIPKAEVADRCVYLQAVIKETLRLYAPLPSTEPRSTGDDTTVDGYVIPRNTVVGMSPWIMHRNEEVFENPLVFNPERWLGDKASEMNRWFWGFSSGGRMCIGMHLAMAEMTVLGAALYREYKTTIAPGFENTSPAITARVETFYDERFPKVKESTCLLLVIASSLFLLPVSAGGEPKQWTPDDPCPTSINAVAGEYAEDKSSFRTYELVHEALQICPGVIELNMTTKYLGSFGMENRLPFKLDGSERYSSVPQILSLTDYPFDHNEWSYLKPGGRHHWSGENGTWPVSSSTNPVTVWTVDMFYRARWHWECLQAFVRYVSLLPWLSYRNERMYHGYSKIWYYPRYTPVERRSMENIQRWLETMDFSHVHTLTIVESARTPKGKGLYQDLPRALTGLKTLEIQGQWLKYLDEFYLWNEHHFRRVDDRLPMITSSETTLPPALDFITAVNSRLESLTWTKSGPVRDELLEPVLKHHGSSLKHLECTNTELKWSGFPVEQIRSLGRWAPGLTSLAINLDRVDGSWPWKHLKAIAENLPKLTNLTIYLNMYDETSSFELDSEEFRPAKPALTKEASLDMFSILNLFKAGDKLRNVEFRQGDWEGSSFRFVMHQGIKEVIIVDAAKVT